MPQIDNWTYPGHSPVLARCREAVVLCSDKLPKPCNYNTYFGKQFRQLRLCVELAEFDLLFRQAKGLSATLDQLECICNILIESCEGYTPTTVLPLEEELLVNKNTFRLILKWMNERMSSASESLNE
jgi:hypothetical protein